MAARYVEQFTVRTPDEFEELEEAIGDGQLEAVVIDVPDGATAFQTAREFRRILNVARAADVDIELSTDDPLRRELARIIGLRLSSDRVLDTPIPDLPFQADRSDSRTYRIVRPSETKTVDVTAQETSWHDANTRPAFRPWQPRDEAEIEDELDEDDDDEASFSFVIHPPSTRRTATQTFERPSRQTETIPSFEVWEAEHANGPYVHRAPSHRRQLRPFAMLSLVLTVTLAGALLALFLLPTATIAVTPANSVVSSRLTYGVALPGTNWDIAIQPESISRTLTFSATIPTTGERFEPAAPARGVVLLTNASTIDVAVPAGTILASESDIQFATVADVVVPAADPYGSLTIGSSTVEVVATVAGPDSDVAAEMVYGQLDSGIYYLNREPISGGTLRRIATVSQADIDALNDRAKRDLESRAIGAMSEGLSEGQQLLANTEHRGQIQSQFDHAVGEDAETLTLNATLAISAQAYNLTDVHEQARHAVAERLRIQAGEQVVVLDETLQTSEPEPVSEANGTAFVIEARATARSIVHETELDALKQVLAGMNADDAMARIKQVEGVGGVTIDHSPGWLGGRMPRFDSRIQIEVVNAARVPTQATSPGP